MANKTPTKCFSHVLEAGLKKTPIWKPNEELNAISFRTRWPYPAFVYVRTERDAIQLAKRDHSRWEIFLKIGLRTVN